MSHLWEISVRTVREVCPERVCRKVDIEYYWVLRPSRPYPNRGKMFTPVSLCLTNKFQGHDLRPIRLDLGTPGREGRLRVNLQFTTSLVRVTTETLLPDFVTTV